MAILASDDIAERARDGICTGSDWSFATSWLVQVPGESLGESLAALTSFVQAEPFVVHLADSLAEERLAGVLGNADVDPLGAVVLTHGCEASVAPVVDMHSRRQTHGRRTAGVAVVGRAVLATTATIDARPGNEVNQLVDHLTGIGGSVEFRSTDAWWRFGEATDTMLAGNRFALERLRAGPIHAHLRDSIVEGAVSIHPSARVESSTVRGPAVIGPGARLDSAYVGPFTSIGADCADRGSRDRELGDPPRRGRHTSRHQARGQRDWAWGTRIQGLPPTPSDAAEHRTRRGGRRHLAATATLPTGSTLIPPPRSGRRQPIPVALAHHMGHAAVRNGVTGTAKIHAFARILQKTGVAALVRRTGGLA